jgi:gas vesicle protein
MSESNRYSGAHLLVAFVVGAAAGAAVAFFAKSESGQELGGRIKEWALDASEKAKRVPGAAKEAWSRSSEAAKQAFREAMVKDPSKKDDVT